MIDQISIPDEVILLQQLRRGERKAQDKIYNAFADDMLRICRRILKIEEDAEDALIQGFDRFFREIRREAISGPSAIRKFLNCCMKRAAIDVWRLRKKQVLIPEDYLPETTQEPEAYCELHREDLSVLMDRILPESQRLVISMAYSGYSHEEVWKILGIPEASSRALLSKARMRMLMVLYAQGIFPYCID